MLYGSIKMFKDLIPATQSAEAGIHKGAVILTFFTFWVITTHPWLPKGPRIWKLAKKNFQLHPWPAEIFGKNRKMRFFVMISKFTFSSPVQQIFTIFQHVLFMGSLIHIQNLGLESKTVVTREWSRQGSKSICLKVWKVNFI